MKLVLIASTTIHNHFLNTPWVNYVDDDSEQYDDWTEAADYLTEFAGRACYESWDRPNEATATNATYIAHILDVRHWSLLKHSSATFYVTGVSRSLLVELERHTYIALSVRSQRYVDESDANIIMPPAMRRHILAGGDPDGLMQFAWNKVTKASLESYDDIAGMLVDAGLKRKQAREAARAVLPGATETRFVATGSLLAWRELIQKRTQVDENDRPLADLEFYEFAQVILRQLKELAPNSFQDM